MRSARHRVIPPSLEGWGWSMGVAHAPFLQQKQGLGQGGSVQLLPFPAKPHSAGIGGLSCSS